MSSGNVPPSCTELIFQIIMEYSGKTTVAPKPEQRLSLSLTAPPAPRNLFSNGANNEVWRTLTEDQKALF